MYSRRLSVSTRILTLVSHRAPQQRNSTLSKLFPFARNTAYCSVQGDFCHGGQAKHGSFSVRHFGTDSSDHEKDKETKKYKLDEMGQVVQNTSSKTDYKKMALETIKSGANTTYLFFRHPTLIPGKTKHLWEVIKEEAHHYYLGFKLLSADVRTAKDIIFRILEGHSMTRRERLQLMRTVTDLARLVPFSIFILIPFMELLLPVAIKMFPNMLPSTFEDSLKKEETLKNELNMRLSVASFFIDTIKTMAEQRKSKSSGAEGESEDEAKDDKASATELIEFMEKARMGEPLPHEAVVRIARLFKDELTLANMPRPQLVTMCQFMNLQPFGSDTFLRFQLRTKLNSIKEDDKRILWEGVESLSASELRDACRERGMRATGLNTFGYRKQIAEWLDLSMLKHTPISLLIMSRAFVLNLSKENRQARYEESLKTSLSSMDEDVVNEVIVQSASAKEVSTADMKKRKLESLQFQNEMIAEELEVELEYKRKEKEGDDKPSKENKESVIGIAEAVVKEDFPSSPLPSVSDSGSSDPSDTLIAKEFIRLADGGLFEGDVLKEKEKGEEVVEGCSLTASEVQALGDMALQSAVDREKIELAKLKSAIKSLKLERKAKGSGSGDVSVSTRAIMEAYEKEVNGKSREVSQEVKEDDLVYNESPAQAAESGEATSSLDEGKSDGDAGGDEVTLNTSSGDVDEEDVSLMRMKSLVDGMMTRLEDRLTKTESELGDKLHKLDVDRDGVLNSTELTAAVLKLLKRHSSSGPEGGEGQQEAADLIRLLDQDKDGRITVKELIEYVASRDVLTEEETKMFESHKPKKDKASSPPQEE